MLPVPELHYCRYYWRKAGQRARLEAEHREEEEHPAGFSSWAHTEEAQQLIHLWYLVEQYARRNHPDGIIEERPERVVTHTYARNLAEEELFDDQLRQALWLIEMVWPYAKCDIEWQDDDWRNQEIFLR